MLLENLSQKYTCLSLIYKFSLIYFSFFFTACAPSEGYLAYKSETLTNLNNQNSASTEPTFKPEALSWSAKNHPEREAWSLALFDYVSSHLVSLNQAKDITSFCQNYWSMNRDQQVNTWAALIAATTYYESSYNPLSNSVDVGSAGNRDTWSVGLLQLSVTDQKNHGFQFGFNFSDLQNPIKNLQLGVAILAKQVIKYKTILIPMGGKGLYWAVLHPGGKYDRSSKIIQMTKNLSFCD